MTSPHIASDAAKSRFVTVVAWVFVVITGLSILSAVSQASTLRAMLSTEDYPNMSPLAGSIFGNPRVFVLGFLALSVTTFVSAIAMLKRKNWGRLLFVSVMCFWIAWNVVCIVLLLGMFPSTPESPVNAPPAVRSQIQMMANFVRVFLVVVPVGLSILFGWIVKRLLSPTIGREFTKLSA